MTRTRMARTSRVFEAVTRVGLTLPGVEATTKYDGSPVLKVRGSFVAGLATHPSAEPETLVVRIGLEERKSLLEDAPATYYVTGYYQRYPVVLARLSRLDEERPARSAVGLAASGAAENCEARPPASRS